MSLSLAPEKHRVIFLFGLLLTVFGLSLGAFPLSAGQLILGANWLWEGDFRQKFQRLKRNRGWLIFAAFFFLHVIGLAWSEDFSYGINDVKIKVPLFSLPLIFASTPSLNQKELKTLLSVYVLGIVVSSLWSMVFFTGIKQLPQHDVRSLSRFFSHIRFSMNIVYGIFISGWFAMGESKSSQRLLWLAAAMWLTIFLFILSSLTGIVIFTLLVIILLTVYVIRKRKVWIGFGVAAVVITFCIFSVTYIRTAYQSYFSPKEEAFPDANEVTLSGSKYWHDISNSRENGNLVWRYLSPDEMEEEWNKRSKLDYNAKDKKGNPLAFTLARYLTSKGWRKDSVAISKLTKKDIESIEKGIPNYRLVSASPFERRLYDLLWEINDFTENGKVHNHSVMQKLLYWKTGWKIAKENFVIGVGTGDVQLAFNAQYEKDNSVLKSDERKRAHNQYLTALIALGIPGLLLMIGIVLYPFLKLKETHQLFFPVCWILFFSMLTEDTLETQAGVTMFAFFVALFLFLLPSKQNGTTFQQSAL